MIEAKKRIKRSKSFSNLHDNDCVIQDLNFSSAILSQIFPNTLSYIELTQFMKSPQYKTRLRGQIPSFEKMLDQFKCSKENKSNNPVDLTEFFKRDDELLKNKKRLSNPPPQKILKYANELSLKIIKKMDKKKDKSAQGETTKKTVLSPATPKTFSKQFPKNEKCYSQAKSARSYAKSKFRLMYTAEQMANIKKTRQEIMEFEEKSRLN